MADTIVTFHLDTFSLSLIVGNVWLMGRKNFQRMLRTIRPFQHENASALDELRRGLLSCEAEAKTAMEEAGRRLEAEHKTVYRYARGEKAQRAREANHELERKLQDATQKYKAVSALRKIFEEEN